MQWLVKNQYRRSLTSFLRVLRNIRAVPAVTCKLCEDIKDVRDFGAICDGVTDNTSAVQSAVDSLPVSGGLVFVPGGCSYDLNSIVFGPDDYLMEAGDEFLIYASGGAILRFDGDAIYHDFSLVFPISGTQPGFLFQNEGTGSYRSIKSELSGIVDPTSTDDFGKNYEVGSRWINVTDDREFVLLDSTISGAVWKDTTLSGVISGTLDHGALFGLPDDDHPQYVLANGTRPMSGSFDLATNNIINVGTINGIRHYGTASVNPTSPSPEDGDTYFNTSIKEEMRYDETRGKWLSVASWAFHGGRNGNTAAGGYYRATNNMAMNGTNRGYRVPKGTLTFLSIARTDDDVSVLEILVSGSIIASLSSSTFATADETLNADFDEGIMSFRNKDGLNATTNVQIIATIKRRP